MTAVAINNESFAVTGGCGFIGAAVVRELLEQGARRVVVIDSLKAGKRERLPNDVRIAFDASRLGEVSIADLAQTLEGVAGVFHLAAEKHRPSVDSPRDLTLTNLLGTHDIIEASRAAGIRKLVFSSSLYAYGRMAGPPMIETEEPHPHTLYGASKLAGEHLVAAAHRVGHFAGVSLRYFFVYGQGQYVGTGYKSVVVENFDRIRQGEAPVIFGDGRQALDYTHVDDIARATLLAMTNDAGRDVINVGSGQATSVNDLTALMMKVAGVKVEPRFEPPDFTASSCRVADTTHAREAFHYEPGISLEDGLRETWNWIRSRPL